MTGKKLTSINPSTYEVIGEMAISDVLEIKEKVKVARGSFKKWKVVSLQKRIELLRKAIFEFEQRKVEFIGLESQEMGMTINDAIVDFNGSIEYANWYFDNAEKFLTPEVTFKGEGEHHEVRYEPIGVVAVIIPWNFPFANFIWGTLQSLIAGNTVVLKHSEECPLSGKMIEDIMKKHLPDGVFSEVYGGGDAGEALVNQDVNMISFTGSTEVGKIIYKKAGEKFIKAVVELGGSAPGIIYKDADISSAIACVCGSRLFNQGQCCDGLKRLIVDESIMSEVVEQIASNFRSKRVGNASDKKNDIGPLVSKKQLRLLSEQIEDAKNKGAKIICGGNSLEQKLGGAYFEPTVLVDVKNNMRIWNEETFGPVLPIRSFKTNAEAIQQANEGVYGLGAYIFTQNTDIAEEVVKSIQSGMVSVNGVNYIRPFNPFGGYRQSGIGREHGKFGFHEVTQIKIIAKNE